MTAWMEIAWQQQGLQETVGDGATSEIVAMFKAVGRAEITSDEVAWCAAFVGACLARSGGVLADQVLAIPKERRLLASTYETFGTPVPLDQPRVGCIAVIDVGSATGSGRHVTFVSGWTDTTIAGLGGNQRDSVNVSHFRRDKLVALRWPEPPATAASLAAAGSRTVQAAIGQARDSMKAVVALGTGAAAKVAVPDAEGVANAGQVLKGFGQVMGDAAVLAKFGTFCVGQWPWVAGTIALYYLARMAWLAGWIKQARLEDHNTGANTQRSQAHVAAL